MSKVQRAASGAVDIQFPQVGTHDRPRVRPTFMFIGVAVKLSAVPTTAEHLSVVVSAKGDVVEEDFTLNSVDLSDEGLAEWAWSAGDGPWAIGPEDTVKVVYPNTDGNQVTVWFSGYFM